MPHISILSSSVREGRNSHRVALYFKQLIENKSLGTVEILDLKQYNFPLFEERLSLQKNPLPQTLQFAEKIVTSDALIIISPEYNGSMPASLKNVLDLLYKEWYRKPIALASVSSGGFGGTQVMMAMQSVLWKMGAWISPSAYYVPKVEDAYTENGEASDSEATDKRALGFMDELLWAVEANGRMKN
jgi:NAD(P)H-dependent FMN reductase